MVVATEIGTLILREPPVEDRGFVSDESLSWISIPDNVNSSRMYAPEVGTITTNVVFSVSPSELKVNEG